MFCRLGMSSHLWLMIILASDGLTRVQPSRKSRSFWILSLVVNQLLFKPEYQKWVSLFEGAAVQSRHCMLGDFSEACRQVLDGCV